uniref:high affinity cationic amino acid transporter 1-like n=1 Tax=Myxine glutinosa TaxID=7769 RepID=UPI00358F953C
MAAVGICCSRFVGRMSRCKPMVSEDGDGPQLSRCLSALDLVALGVGSTLGAGVYVLAGAVARNNSGPAIVLSFFIAAASSVLAGLCYAEFGARAPKAGSAYLYSYLTVGELCAFVTGWNLILSYVIGTSSVSRAWSATFDGIFGGAISSWMVSVAPMNLSGLAPYPDALAVIIIMLLSGVLSFGVAESALITKIFTAINVLVIVFVMVAGLVMGDPANWDIDPNVVLNNTNMTITVDNLGVGGFLPFGVVGMLAGAATCFYAFVGFDCIATTGEEVKNPQHAIPLAIIVSLLICFVAYFGVSAALTLLMPYYLLDEESPIPAAFQYVGWDPARYLVAVGSLCALSTSLLGSMFPLPRVVFAMARDGLLFRWLSRVSKRHTPVAATLSSGALAALMALLFELKELVEMMSIGTLSAYSLVSVCVLILRYRMDEDEERFVDHEQEEEEEQRGGMVLMDLLNPKSAEPTKTTSRRAELSILTATLAIVVFCIFTAVCHKPLASGTIWAAIIAALLLVTVFAATMLVWRQPQSQASLAFKIFIDIRGFCLAIFGTFIDLRGLSSTFSGFASPFADFASPFADISKSCGRDMNETWWTGWVPLLPFLPVVSMLVNMYLMVQLDSGTWTKFAVWMIAGFAIYFAYGMWHSSEELNQRRHSAKELRSPVSSASATLPSEPLDSDIN